MYNALIFDTETTGLLRTHLADDNKQPYICEFYGCIADLETGAPPWSELHTLIKPPITMPEGALKSHQLTDAMLMNAPAFTEVADKIKDYIESAEVAIAHNFSFDQEMVDIQFERMGRSVRWPYGICTVEQTIHLKGRRLKLAELYEYLFNQTFMDAHRARNDTQALLRICRELYKRGYI